MKVGTDFDATISLPSRMFGASMQLFRLNIAWPSWFFFFQPWLIFAKPNWAMVNELWRRKKNGDEIFVVTSRPECARALTMVWLKQNSVVFDQLHCVGSRAGKISLIEKESIVMFYDDDLEIREILREKGVEAKPPL